MFADRPGGLVYTSKLKPGAAGHKEERRLKWRRRLPPGRPRTDHRKKQKSIKHLSTPLGGGWAPISSSPILSNPQRRHLRPGIQSDLRSPSSISNLQRRHLRPDSVRSPISISNLQSPISIRGPGGGGGLKPSRRCAMDSFTLTISHLQSPIFYLATVAAGSNLRPPFSIFDLTSGADGWALGSTICILHLLSPHFGPCCCSAICNPQSQSSIFSLEWGTGLEGSTGETWACPCERSARYRISRTTTH